MPKQPFTPAGVDNTFTTLYALSDPALLTQANSLRSDYRGWVKNHFSLTTNQESYLENIDDKFIKLAACLTGFAMENRLVVTLGVSDDDTGLKLIHLANDLLANYDASNGFSVTGGVYYTIEYQ